MATSVGLSNAAPQWLTLGSPAYTQQFGAPQQTGNTDENGQPITNGPYAGNFGSIPQPIVDMIQKAGGIGDWQGPGGSQQYDAAGQEVTQQSLLNEKLQQLGISRAVSADGQHWAYVDANGQPIPGTVDAGASEDSKFWMGAMLAGGVVGGAAAGFAGAGAAGTELPSGMDLAGDAALGSGNNVVTAGSALGGGTGATGTGLAELAGGGGDADGLGVGGSDANAAPGLSSQSSTLGNGQAFDPEGVTNPNFGQGADFAKVSAANGGVGNAMSDLSDLGWAQLATQIGGQLIGGALQYSTASKAQDVAQSGVNAASAAAADQLAFDKQKYADMKPTIDALGQQAISSAALDQQIAQQTAARSQTAWEQNQQATQGAVGQMGLNALGAQYLTPEQTQQLVQLQQVMATGTPDQKAAAQAQLATLQRAAESAGIGLENAKGAALVNNAAGQAQQVIGLGEQGAKSILDDSGTIQGDLNSMGDARRADQTGFYNTQAQTVRDVAQQRANANELRGTTQANADIANAAGQANRELLRLGGDPNKMAAMSADIANGQQLARIGSGNQVAATNISNLNAADDQARGLETTGFNAGTAQQYGAQDQALALKSSALDSARNMRLQAQSTAQGLTFGAQNQATSIDNNAKDKVDAGLNSLQQGTANFGAGFANTSGQAAQTSIAAGTAGTTGLATGLNSATYAAGVTNNAYGNAQTAAKTGISASQPILAAGTSGASAVSGTAGSLAGFITSSKTKKKNRQPVDPDQALAGLEDAMPETYDYKDGEGPPGRKIGAMAEDMQEQFGDDVAPGGKVINTQNMIGLQHAAIVGLSKRVKQLERRAD